jgi:hypothetical protein
MQKSDKWLLPTSICPIYINFPIGICNHTHSQHPPIVIALIPTISPRSQTISQNNLFFLICNILFMGFEFLFSHVSFVTRPQIVSSSTDSPLLSVLLASFLDFLTSKKSQHKCPLRLSYLKSNLSPLLLTFSSDPVFSGLDTDSILPIHIIPYSSPTSISSFLTTLESAKLPNLHVPIFQ